MTGGIVCSGDQSGHAPPGKEDSSGAYVLSGSRGHSAVGSSDDEDYREDDHAKQP